MTGKKYKKCSHCNGTGYHKKIKCPQCKGSGKILIKKKTFDYGAKMFSPEAWK
jgi:DnaJ-class molecular chaperone